MKLLRDRGLEEVSENDERGLEEIFLAMLENMLRAVLRMFGNVFVGEGISSLWASCSWHVVSIWISWPTRDA